MNKIYNLEARTYQLTIDIVAFCKTINWKTPEYVLVNQLIRSVGSIGANYIEANEGLSKKDQIKYMRIARKESKEALYWLKILCDTNTLKTNLIQETEEIKKILSVIIQKLTQT